MTRIYNVIDADGHILEPVDLWTKNIDKKYRDRAPVPKVGPDGKPRFWIDGQFLGQPLGLITTGGVGVPIEQMGSMTYTDGRPGGFDPHERIKDLDVDGIDAAFLYPSLGLMNGAIKDPDLAAAVCRTYNQWIAEYCKPYPDRLFGVAMLPMQSVSHAVTELRYARKKFGLRAGFVRPNNELPLSDRSFDPLWAEAQELDVSIGLHEGGGGPPAVGANRVEGFAARHIVSHTMEMMLACVNVIWGGVCERFPKLRFGFLESGGGWMVPWLDRMDRHFARKGHLDTIAISMAPSEYFRRQCWISFEPIEVTIGDAARHLGSNKILWATDYPHADGFFPGAPAMVAERVPPELRKSVLAQGAIDFYNLS